MNPVAMTITNPWKVNSRAGSQTSNPIISCPVSYRLHFGAGHQNLKTTMLCTGFIVAVPEHVSSSFCMFWCLLTVFQLELNSIRFLS